jgi:hypothetical protein
MTKLLKSVKLTKPSYRLGAASGFFALHRSLPLSIPLVAEGSSLVRVEVPPWEFLCAMFETTWR